MEDGKNKRNEENQQIYIQVKKLCIVYKRQEMEEKNQVYI